MASAKSITLSSPARLGPSVGGAGYSTKTGLTSSGLDRRSSFSAYDSLFQQLRDIQSQNNAWSASQAQRQMDFQSSEGAKARQFNHDEAELNRSWQEYMSSTAHQREIKDLSAAGLNPVLSAMGGSGAPVTSGATASGYSPGSGAKGDTDTSLSSALVGLFSSMLQSQTALTNQAVSAQNNLAVAEKYTSMQELLGRLQSETSYGVAAIQRGTTLDAANISALSQQIVAKIYAGATVSSAQISADASKVSASIHAAAQKYGYDLSAMTQSKLASFNADLQRELKKQGLDYDLVLQNNSRDNELIIREENPSSMAGLLSSSKIFKNLAGLISPSSSYFGGSGSRSSAKSESELRDYFKNLFS